MNALQDDTLPVADLDTARRFYVHVLGCVPRSVPRSAAWTGAGAGRPAPAGAEPDRPAPGPDGSGHVDLELFGQPLSLRLDAAAAGSAGAAFVLGVDDWCTLSERLRAHGLEPTIEPGRRFSAVPGEQCAMRLSDPDGNAIELRGFAQEADQLAA